ncbi:hypothetical protein ELI44_11020 [Rhizobium ruizarguesonis]|uniref:hypothetical protein n=1 Tax=Rhizobium ruizarguesonis TaxID=2081791 RepID=UPI001030892C|nr:hypothetical protein [Rhizobium ruizarguesonis]TAU48504.1 hypothetical protein ELI42_10985 [Rhizobium ruizarguesonis]TAU63577.1 hypothetical protein ELI44_11020 [Rhizobium ruizarguesonis]TBA21501.1 hypothetical protein ELH66_11245 [Rhizobium ruizarguesonis]TBD63924.1 hypothetical protein ELH22_11735 [Rhizobium ruizarguesonis]
MSEFRLAFPACVVAGKHRLTAEDMILLRKHAFPQGIRTSDDVVAMLALNNSCPEKCAAWNAFFVEQLAGFIVHYTYPQGSLDEINVAWIMRMFTTDGVVNSALELELILHVMEISADVPGELRALTLDQLRLAITDNIGGYKLSRAIDRRGISRQDVDFAMRIFRSVAEGGVIPVSSVEYGVLQQIERATLAGANHPHWAGIMAAVELRDYAEPRRSRWLRIVDEEPVSAAAVA